MRTSEPSTRQGAAFGGARLIMMGVSAALGGATLFLSGYWVGAVRAADTTLRPAVDVPPTPDWFLSIADAYERNPQVTPAFDFSLLYDARPGRYESLTARHRPARR